LTEEELSELKQVQRNVVGTDYIEVTGILMLHRVISPHTVSELFGMDVSTVYHYAALYTGGVIGTLRANRNRGYREMLSGHETGRLRTALKRNIYTDSRGISSWIKAAFGVSCTRKGVAELPNRIGFTDKKTKEVPCERKQCAKAGNPCIRTFGNNCRHG
jgi:transposase